MRKHYLILVLFFLIIPMLKADARDRGNPLSHASSKTEMTPCDPPIVNADTLLLQYLTNEPLTAVGGVPPYTYTFSPAISTSSLVALLTSTVTTVYTITVTGANGCDSVYHATYVPLPGGTTGGCTTVFLSEYIQDTVPNPSGDGINDAIELYNPTYGTINLNGYYLIGTTNGSLYATPFFIALHGTIAAHKTFLIANTNADTALTHKAGMLSDSLNFGGKDIVALAKISLTPTVTFSFLDEVGAITPLPTDSGWAVGSGSTKNHTLVRQVSVTQGDLNWATCRYEWNVYPRGTFSYIGHYENTCYIDPTLTISLANASVACGTPSFFGFDVMASSNPSTILNSCSVEIKYTGAEFSGDLFFNGNIAIDVGPNFRDYASDINVNQLTDSTLLINFGSTYDSSINGTLLDSTPQEIMRIGLEIQNSCATGKVSLSDTTQKYGQYAYIDSLGHLDSVKSSYTLSNPRLCGDSTGPVYLCSPFCCDTDMYGNCDSVCYWDTCTQYPIYCYDTAWVYSPDSVYTIVSYANLSYTHVIYSADDSIISEASGCPPIISGHLDSINAGTNAASDPANSSILTIKGANFGNEKGFIEVPNADSGGSNQVFLDSTDILLWTNSQIVIKMPSVIISNFSMTPGSGGVLLFNTCSGSGQTTLTINYNIMSEVLSNEKLRYNMAMSNDSNSIVFRCDTSISNYPRIYADVLQAIETWNCYTGVHWRMGNDTILESNAQDGISNIYFTNSLPLGIGMETFPHVDNTCNDLGDSMAYVHESDIAIGRIPYVGYSWNYNVSDTTFPGRNYYFYDVLLHELGHAHLLNHVDDTNSVMYWHANAHARRNLLTGDYPGPQTLYAGFDVVNTSAVNTPSCSYGILIPSPRTCIDHTMDVPSINTNTYNLNLYPNPVGNGNVTISYELTQDSYIQFKIIDYTGREIMTLSDEHKLPGSYKEQINTDAFANGIYLFIANINGTVQTIKFIKL